MNNIQPRGGASRAALTLLLGAFLAATSSLPAAKPEKAKGGNGNTVSATTYSGQATALRIEGIDKPEPMTIIICDTGPLPAEGGMLTVSDSNINIAQGGLTIKEAFSQATGSGPEASAESSLTGYRVEFIEDDSGHQHRALIEADYIYGRVAATIGRDGRITQSSQVIIEGLKINGVPVIVTGEPNQRVELPPEMGGWMILNEQATATSGGNSDIAVSPIHFFVCHCIEGHVGLVRAGVTHQGAPPAPSDCGKITGGGWILGTPSGEKGTFGMSGGIRRGEFWGHLTFQDHGNGMSVKSTAVTGFREDGSARIINYNVTIDGAPGTATLRVVDNGEPGRNDIFDLTLSTGYRAAGDLGGDRSGGGNIQLHKCPPGWE
jgi:hypothetical protein